MSSLACMIKDGSSYAVVEDLINKKTYTNPVHQMLFSSIRDLYNQDTMPDKVTLEFDLKNRGILDNIILFSNGLKGKEAIEYLYSLDVKVEQLESYAFQLSQLQGKRETHEILTRQLELLEGGQDWIATWSSLDLEGGKISSYAGGSSRGLREIKDVIEDGVRNLTNAIENKHLFISTGISAWDDFVNGLFPKRLYLVSARAGKGKSTICINLAYRLAILGTTKVTYFTFESESTDVTNKMIQIMTGVSTKKIDKGILTEEEKEKYYNAAKKLKESKNLIMDDSSEVLLPVLRSKIRKAVESGSKLIIIDQLEQILVGGGGDNTQQEHIKINYLSYRMKAFAKEFNVPIILVHQMNRSIEAGANRGKDNKPQSSDLAQAGEKAPNAILMVSRFENKTYFDWVKNRDYGDIGRREVNFVIDNLWYEDIDGLSEFTNN